MCEKRQLVKMITIPALRQLLTSVLLTPGGYSDERGAALGFGDGRSAAIPAWTAALTEPEDAIGAFLRLSQVLAELRDIIASQRQRNHPKIAE